MNAIPFAVANFIYCAAWLMSFCVKSKKVFDIFALMRSCGIAAMLMWAVLEVIHGYRT